MINNNSKLKIILTLMIFLAVFLLPKISLATTYYIDFENGSDNNDGLSPNTAWKHSPGDPAAQGLPASKILSAGDKVFFKGGVRYRGSIKINASGTPDNPITFSTAPNWGTGKAIIDGTEPINLVPYQGNIYYAQLSFVPNINTVLIEGDKWINMAQVPKLTEPFYYDLVEEYRGILSGLTRTSCTDPEFFTQSDPNYWVGAYIRVHVYGNRVSVRKIKSYDPNTHTVTFDDLGQDPEEFEGKYHYAVSGKVNLISSPGEFAIDEENMRVYVWPYSNPENIRISTRPYGIYIVVQSFIIIENLIFEGQSGIDFLSGRAIHISTQNSSEGIIIRGCEIRNINAESSSAAVFGFNRNDVSYYTIIENNYLHHIQGRGVGTVGDLYKINGNKLRFVTGTGIFMQRCHSGEIADNDIDQCAGTHSNGISVYNQSSDVVVKNNKVLNFRSKTGPYAITHSDSHRLTFYNNIVDGKFYGWGPNEGCEFLRFFNNTITELSYIASANKCSEISWINNITAGIDKNSMTIHKYNLYTDWFWTQKSGWQMGEGESYEPDKSKIFVDYANDNYHLKSGSPAINAGMNLSSYGVTEDIERISRPQGAAWDIGAYEYVEAAPTDTTPPAAPRNVTII